MVRKKAEHAFGLSADQQRAFERLLKSRGILPGAFVEFLLKAENRKALDLLIREANDARSRAQAAPAIEERGLAAQQTVPITLIAQQQIGSLEAVCHHLRTQGLRYAEIAILLNRDPRTIWVSCWNARQRLSGRALASQPGDLRIPLAIFANRQLGILEAVVVYLREEQGMKPWQIAQLLKRDPRVIATVWQCARRKRHTAARTGNVGVSA